MRYIFPEIIEFEPVRELVLNAEGFTIIRKSDHIVFCYAYNAPESFPEVVSWEDVFIQNAKKPLVTLLATMSSDRFPATI